MGKVAIDCVGCTGTGEGIKAVTAEITRMVKWDLLMEKGWGRGERGLTGSKGYMGMGTYRIALDTFRLCFDDAAGVFTRRYPARFESHMRERSFLLWGLATTNSLIQLLLQNIRSIMNALKVLETCPFPVLYQLKSCSGAVLKPTNIPLQHPNLPTHIPHPTAT